MSAWMLVARALYEHGPASTGTLELHLGGAFAAGAALGHARNYGLVVSPGRCGLGRPGLWSLTQRGIDWCEGRLVAFRGPHPVDRHADGTAKVFVHPHLKLRFAATWLMSLPRGVSIHPKRDVAIEKELELA